MGLVVGRKPGEEVVITTPTGEKIVVGVIKNEDGLTRLNIDAPRDFEILRGELVARK